MGSSGPTSAAKGSCLTIVSAVAVGQNRYAGTSDEPVAIGVTKHLPLRGIDPVTASRAEATQISTEPDDACSEGAGDDPSVKASTVPHRIG